MNYKYSSPDDEGRQPGQGQPMIFQLPIGPPIQQQHEENFKMTATQVDEIHRVKLRQAHAAARAEETRVILQGLREMRDALNLSTITVADGDTGSKDRPPLTPSFNELNSIKIQNAYLRLVERYVNYCDNMLTQELNISVTNEIKKEEPKPEQ